MYLFICFLSMELVCKMFELDLHLVRINTHIYLRVLCQEKGVSTRNDDDRPYKLKLITLSYREGSPSLSKIEVNRWRVSIHAWMNKAAF